MTGENTSSAGRHLGATRRRGVQRAGPAASAVGRFGRAMRALTTRPTAPAWWTPDRRGLLRDGMRQRSIREWAPAAEATLTGQERAAHQRLRAEMAGLCSER